MDLAVKPFRSEAEQDYVDSFAALHEALPGAQDGKVVMLRAEAIERFASLGLPHRRIEAWKYTDLRSRLTESHLLSRPAAGPIEEAEIGKALGARIAALDCYRVVIADREYRPELSDAHGLREAGVELRSLAEALEHLPDDLAPLLGETGEQRSGFEAARPTGRSGAGPDPILALNAAFMTDGAVIRVGDGVALEKPLHVIHLDGAGEPVASSTRLIVLAGKASSLTLIESYAGLGGRGLQRNAVTQLVAGEDSLVEHCKLQREGEEAIHLSNWLVTLKTNARYNGFHYTMGADLARNDVRVHFEGEGGSMNFSGATLLKGRQHCDTTMVVEHLVPHCTSRELYKAVLDEESRAVFQAKVIVARDAQKTDGKQMGQALLLSEGAEFDTKPELEIFADDVICGHGATSGQIDEDLLFYLEARGIPESQARALLVQAFIGEALEQIGHEPLRDALNAVTADWLGIDLG